MFKYYLIIKGINNLSFEELQIFDELLKDLLVYPSIEVEDNFIYIKDHSKTDVVWAEFIDSSNANFLSDLKLYESISFQNEKELEIHLLENKNKDIFIDNYNNDITLFHNDIKVHVSEEKKKEIFKSLYNDTEFLRSIKIYLDTNQNKSKAAKLANLHRNSLENRLEKFYNITGYDVRKFADASFIYLFLK